MGKTTFFWFRRDLRLFDNTGLLHALNTQTNVIAVFIFDSSILNQLDNRSDARVTFIYEQLLKLKAKLEEKGSSLLVLHGKPTDLVKTLCDRYDVAAVYANHDYEPQAIIRDKAVKVLLEDKNIPFHTFKDQCIFEKNEIVKKDGLPYTVFTPYMKKWKQTLEASMLAPAFSNIRWESLRPCKPFYMPALKELGFQQSLLKFPPAVVNEELLKQYDVNRDFPAKNGTSRTSLHLRFGTLSIRALVKMGMQRSQAWLNELIWREFYMMILWHFPWVVEQSFKKKYDRIPWRQDEKGFQAWCEGRTGYPMVDAGMRELNATGFMHNRLRMITASFLVKHLLIDWRWGAAYFARQLLDFELSSNNGGWQWAAGTGCDAAPYFRVFNPERQSTLFDPENVYIKKWVSEVDERIYPTPIVDHKTARNRAIATYKKALEEQ